MGRPKEHPVHIMEIGDCEWVPDHMLESTKAIAYKMNSLGIKKFSFHKDDKKRYVRRLK